ncbi:hypothetical protein B0H67DRAFT_572260 [Lasiosphaeris hirsuta]|uniref:Secreted protein n=1 Tax=Lasiosphaeris hirsuta TaxID=260670 RepID=A0AA40B1P6_9PEZI|nr:hypothetical protein B0H67DRAFT_572260 [Lasiosphaeris hirsuta]
MTAMNPEAIIGLLALAITLPTTVMAMMKCYNNLRERRCSRRLDGWLHFARFTKMPTRQLNPLTSIFTSEECSISHFPTRPTLYTAASRPDRVSILPFRSESDVFRTAVAWECVNQTTYRNAIASPEP